jgi:hypothetical protein
VGRGSERHKRLSIHTRDGQGIYSRPEDDRARIGGNEGRKEGREEIGCLVMFDIPCSERFPNMLQSFFLLLFSGCHKMSWLIGVMFASFMVPRFILTRKAL